MSNFSEEVNRISVQFFNEAKSSPQLLSDLAKMEYYMAESYSGRVFIELLQNADDANAKRVISYSTNNFLIFANDGRPFDKNDIISIARSGASNKTRGQSIGYRGIGFKSASSVSDEIIIFSSGVYFSFSKSLCAQYLNTDSSNVPTIRIPILIKNINDEIQTECISLLNKGYKTIFIFNKPRMTFYYQEIDELDSGFFIFLNSISECNINFFGRQKKFSVQRRIENNNRLVTITSTEETNTWLLFDRNRTSVAFLLQNGIIVPCSSNEALFHCFLPTLDKSFVRCKINADFSTDPSRKHIVLDEKTNTALSDIAFLFVDICKKAVRESVSDVYKNFFSILLKKELISRINIAFDELFDKAIRGTSWIPLMNGRICQIEDYKLFPSTFEIDNPLIIRTCSNRLTKDAMAPTIYEKLDCFDCFISQYSKSFFPISEMITALGEDPLFVEKIPNESYIQLLCGIIREAKLVCSLQHCSINFDKLLLKDENNSFRPVSDIASNKMKINLKLAQELSLRLGQSEIQWFKSVTHIQKLCEPKYNFNEINQNDNHLWQNNSITQEISTQINPHISKWRDAESKCVEIEKVMGNDATDVSLQNLGYDVFSKDIDGRKRYIEVKSVKRDYSFSLTNNEYTAAMQYGDEYYVCLLCENQNQLEVKYINNPIKNAVFEKRIKQWEWACLDFSYTIFKYDLE